MTGSDPAPRHDASLSYTYPTRSRARVVERSVRRELDEIDGDRSDAAVERDGPTLRVTVTASDLVALRAGLNTWQSLVAVAEGAAAAAAAERPPRGDPED